MSRYRVRSLRLLTLIGAATLFLAGCGAASQEEQILTTFFRAARVRDNATLANLATVEFNPRTEGSVQDFKVANIGLEERHTIEVQQLRDEEAKAVADDEEFAKKKKAYQDEHLPALMRISDMQHEGKPITGADAKLAEEWNKWGADQLQTRKRVSQARAKLKAETSLAIGSLTAPGQNDVDISKMGVEMVTKQVTVDAQVKTPDGQTTPQKLVFTFSRAVGKDGATTKEGRWLITGLTKG